MPLTRFSVAPLHTLTRTLAAVAMGREAPDLVITGARILSTYTERVHEGREIWLKSGRIAAVNHAWRKLAETRHWPWPSAGVGLQYLEIFRAAFGCSADVSREILSGVHSVIANASDCFVSSGLRCV